jgi:nucleoside-diphosphate-sugar epimerase
MRIFFAGASGVIGTNLIPMLVEQGHVVAGMTRTESKIDKVRSLGAQPFLVDVYDVGELTESVADFKPDMVMHQLTDLPDDSSMIDAYSSRNARMRREGTLNLIAAAREADCDRLIAQSVPWMSDAIRDHEQYVMGYNGVILRYGNLYGPGTFYASREDAPEPRVDVAEAARRTMDNLDAPPATVIEIIE